MSSLLGRLFRIEQGEGRAVGFCLLQAVFLGLPRLFTLTVGAALFLERHAAEDIPAVYIAAAFLIPAAGFLHLWISKRVSFVRLQLGTLLALAAVPAAFLLLLRSTSAAWPAFALFVWCGAELHLTNIVLWSTANRIFTVRQGKRLFGLIGAGEIVAAIAGGAAVPALTHLLGTVDLLAISIVGFLASFLAFASMSRVPRRRLAHAVEPAAVAPAGWHELLSIFRDRFLLLVWLISALALSAGFFVNNIFYFQVKETFPAAADVTVFLGRYMALTSVLGLTFRSLLSGRFLVRIGLVGGLLATPAALLGAALVVVFLGRSGMPTEVFWSVAVLRLLDRVLTGSLGQPAYYSLYQPLTRERRARVQSAIDLIASPVVGGLTGAALLLLTKGLGLTAVGLAICVVPVLGAWLGASVAVGRTFPAVLTRALRRRGVTGGDLAVGDPASLRILERGLESPRSTEVLYCLRLLREAEHPRLGDLLRRLAEHPDAAVRAGAYEAIETLADPTWEPFLATCLEHERAAACRGNLLRAMGAAGRATARTRLEPHAAAPEDVVRRGAMVALVRYAEVGDDHPAALELDRLVRSADGGERVTAALALGEIGTARAIPGLASLLADADLGVRRVALRAAGRLGSQPIMRSVIPSLAVPEVRGEAIRALLAAPAVATQALIEVYREPASSPALRRAILQVLGRTREVAATSFLVEELGAARGPLLTEVLWSLHQRQFRAAGADRSTVETAFRDEVRRGGCLVAAQRDLRREPGTELLVAALGQELAHTQKRLFLLLSFIHDAEALLRIWSNFSVSPALRDLALELFEAKVDRAHAKRALPILAGTSEAAPVPAAEHLRRILLGTTPRAAAWLRACAIDACGPRNEALAAADWQTLLDDEDELVRQTARRRFAGAGAGARPEREAADGGVSVVDRVRILRSTSIFREIEDAILAELAPRLVEIAARPDEEIAGEGADVRAMYVVAEGALRLEAPGEIAAHLGPGQVFGELAALEAEATTERVTALSPSRLLRLAHTDLRDFMSMRIEVVRGIIAVLCQRVRSAPLGGARSSRREPARPPLPAATPSVERAEEGLSPLDRVLILKTAEIFSEVPDEVLAEVAGRTQEVRLRKDEVLFRKGDPGTATYIVAAGRLRIFVEDRVLSEVGERAVVGELAALSSEPRTASVAAAEDSLLLALDQDSLFDLMLDQQEITWGIIRVLAGRLWNIHRRARE